MNRLRIDILRKIVIASLCIGFGMYMVQQMQVSHSSHAFASWLNEMVETNTELALQDEIDDLQRSAANLDEFIKEASYLIGDNDNHFGFVDTKEHSQLYQWLLIEWSQFQTGNAMAGIPIPSPAKVLLSVVLDQKDTVGLAVNMGIFPNKVEYKKAVSVDSSPVFSGAIQPMTDGIAIGAP